MLIHMSVGIYALVMDLKDKAEQAVQQNGSDYMKSVTAVTFLKNFKLFIFLE